MLIFKFILGPLGDPKILHFLIFELLLSLLRQLSGKRVPKVLPKRAPELDFEGFGTVLGGFGEDFRVGS